MEGLKVRTPAPFFLSEIVFQTRFNAVVYHSACIFKMLIYICIGKTQHLQAVSLNNLRSFQIVFHAFIRIML